MDAHGVPEVTPKHPKPGQTIIVRQLRSPATPFVMRVAGLVRRRPRSHRPEPDVPLAVVGISGHVAWGNCLYRNPTFTARPGDRATLWLRDITWK